MAIIFIIISVALTVQIIKQECSYQAMKDLMLLYHEMLVKHELIEENEALPMNNDYIPLKPPKFQWTGTRKNNHYHHRII